MCLDYFTTKRQPEPETTLLAGFKGLKQTFSDIGRDAAPVVLNFDLNLAIDKTLTNIHPPLSVAAFTHGFDRVSY